MKRLLLTIPLLIAVVLTVSCNNREDFKELNRKMDRLSSSISDQRYQHDILVKMLEDLTFFETLGDVAWVDKIRLTGPAKPKVKETGNPFQDSLLKNELQFYTYLFIPKNVNTAKKYPLLVFPHGGIHGTLGANYSHIIREMLLQGYIVVAPDYRGSTGYGKSFHQAIDYGGVENEDVLRSRDYVVENYSFIDPDRVGLIGWSHGGMITLMNLIQYPEKYACGYAGVPVSDVAYRLSYKRPSYTNNFTPDYHVGKTPQEDPQEYARRSPVTYAKYLNRPLMITTTVNDDDVGYKEVERMIDSLKFYNKEFEYKIYDAQPGAHVFERIDTKEATDIRYKAYKFLEQYLNPSNPFKSSADMRRAGFRFN